MIPRLEVHYIGRGREELLRGQQVPDQEPDCEAPIDIWTDEGEPLAIVRRLPEEDRAELRRAMVNFPMSTTLRSSGMRNRSSVFGYTARNSVLRREGCRACGAATEAPELHDVIVGAAPVLSQMLAEANPAVTQAAAEAAARIRPEWRMAGTQWTSGVLNQTSALPYHTDANNAPAWNAMVVLRRGTRGGYFHIPAYGLTLPCRDGDVCFFPAYRVLHGVTPIRKVDTDGYRYSAVYYTVARMRECLSPEEELAYGRRARTEREDTLLERQRESGLLTDGR